MRKLGLLLLVTAVACVLHATAGPAAAQSPLDPSLPATGPKRKLSGKLTLTGSYTMSQVAAVWSESFRQFHPDVQIEIQVKGAVNAVNAVTAGEARSACSAAPMLQSEATAFHAKHGHPPVVLTPMYESIAVFVHKDNPIKGLTIKDLDAIFSFTLKRGADEAGRRPGGPRGDRRSGGEADCLSSAGVRRPACRSSSRKSSSPAASSVRTCRRSSATTTCCRSSRRRRPPSASPAPTYTRPRSRMVPLAVQAGQPFVAVDSVEATRGQYPLIRPLQLVINQKPGEPLRRCRRSSSSTSSAGSARKTCSARGCIPIDARPAQIWPSTPSAWERSSKKSKSEIRNPKSRKAEFEIPHSRLAFTRTTSPPQLSQHGRPGIGRTQSMLRMLILVRCWPHSAFASISHTAYGVDPRQDRDRDVNQSDVRDLIVPTSPTTPGLTSRGPWTDGDVSCRRSAARPHCRLPALLAALLRVCFRRRRCPNMPSRGPRWRLGVYSQDTNVGVKILRTVANSPADRAGLEANDNIVAVAGYQVGIVNGQQYDCGNEFELRRLPWPLHAAGPRQPQPQAGQPADPARIAPGEGHRDDRLSQPDLPAAERGGPGRTA